MEIRYNSIKDIKNTAQSNKVLDNDFFDLDLEIKEQKDIPPTQKHVSEGAACSSTCASCQYTCGNCASYQRIC